MRFRISNIKYDSHLLAIDIMEKIRMGVGYINSKCINTKQDEGVIKLHPYMFKLFKCTTPEDFYVVTGVYHALIKTNVCKGYRNFVFSDNTYEKIRRMLQCNYKWNKETMHGGEGSIKSIQFTWALGSTPMSDKNMQDWKLKWSRKEINLWEMK